MVAAATSWTTPALAHPGHEDAGAIAGFLHPLTGMDHLIAMVMVGLWAGLVAGRARWVLPGSFLAAMLGGFAYGALSLQGGAAAEVLIVASLLALGGAVVLKLEAPMALAAGTAGLFGFAHGMAHGLESPGGSTALAFAGGFLMTTAALHGLGLLVAVRLPQTWTRWAGAVAAGFGLVLAATA